MKHGKIGAFARVRRAGRLLAIIAAAMLAFCVSQAAFAETTEDGRFVYEVYDNTVYITSYLGEGETELYIPEEIDGMPVVSVVLKQIAEDGLNYVHNTTVERIVLPESVSRLGGDAFIYFEVLSEVDGLDHISDLGSSAFVGTDVTELVFTDALDRVSQSSFSGEQIESITIPDDLVLEADGIKAPIFYMNSSLESIELIVTGNTPTFVKHGEALYTADMKTLLCYPVCAAPLTYRIPDGVETIAKHAVYSQNGSDQTGYLMDLIIPDSVTTIYEDSFFGEAYGVGPAGYSRAVTPFIRCTEDSYAKEYCDLWEWPYVTVESVSEAQTMDEILDEAVASCITSDMSDYDKALALYYWLCDYAVYDETFTYYEAWDMIFRGTGVCQSYMCTYKMLLDRADVESTWLSMYAISHGVNMVKIDGDWVIVDVTWGDGGEDYYFGMNNEMATVCYGIDIPEKYGTTAKWFKPYRDGIFDSMIEALTAKINGLIEDGTESVTWTDEYGELLLECWPDHMDEWYFAGYLVADRLNDVDWPVPPYEVICTYNSDNSLTVMISYEEKEDVPFTYQLEDGGISILSYTGTEMDVVIPETINGYPVTQIGVSAFEGMAITSVELPDTLEKVCTFAFMGCTELKSITFPESVTDLSDIYILQGCSSLESIVIEGPVTELGNDFAFGCEKLTSVQLPDTITSICLEAFGYCKSLQTIDLPASLESIGSSAFIECTSLESVQLPEGLKTIGGSAFWGCEKITAIELPDSLETLNTYAFIGTSIEELYIPANVSEIGEISCAAMKTLVIDEDNPYYKSVDSMVLTKDGKTVVTCATGISGTVRVPDGVETIEVYAFHNCAGVTEFLLPDSLREIGEYAFNWCDGITEMTIPEGIEHLDDIFGGVMKLERINLPSTLKSLGDGFFSGLWSLKKIDMPDSVEHLGKELFAHSSGVETVTIPAGVTEIGDHVFDYSYIDHIYIHENVVSIGASEMKTIPVIHAVTGSVAQAWAEENGYGFEAVIKPAATELVISRGRLTLTAAGDFSEAALSFSLMPENAIAESVAWASDDETVVTVDDTGAVTAHSVGSAIITATSENGLTATCCVTVKDELITLTLPENLTAIGAEAFRGMDAVEAVVIPDGVETIDAAAFADCGNLMFVVLPDEDISVDDDVFAGNNVFVVYP